MDIWLIQNGDKAGPFNDYDIRSRIEAGELDAETPAWHEHLGDWKPLGEIDNFRQSFKKTAAAMPEPAETPAVAAVAVEESKERSGSERGLHLNRRFWARWLDFYLYSGILWVLLWAIGADIEMMLTQPWIMLAHYLPWCAIEAWMIHRFATTPGKWLLNLKVLNLDGSRLSLSHALARAVRVLIMGAGFGVWLLAMLCHTLSWFTARHLGTTLWDRSGGHFVDATPKRRPRILSYGIILLFAIWLQSIVIIPHTIDQSIEMIEQLSPETAEQLRKNPPWHLPKRH